MFLADICQLDSIRDDELNLQTIPQISFTDVA